MVLYQLDRLIQNIDAHGTTDSHTGSSHAKFVRTTKTSPSSKTSSWSMWHPLS